MRSADKTPATIDEIRTIARRIVWALIMVIVLLFTVYFANEADDDANRRRAIDSVCDTIEDFAMAEERALEAIFKDVVEPERLEEGRETFRAEIQPALESCRV